MLGNQAAAVNLSQCELEILNNQSENGVLDLVCL